MIIPMLCVTIFVILVVWFLLPRVARLMIHTPTAISILDRKSGSAGMPRPISYAVFCLQKKSIQEEGLEQSFTRGSGPGGQQNSKTSSTEVLVHATCSIELRSQRER